MQDMPQDDVPFALAIFLSLSTSEELSGEITKETIDSNVMEFISDMLKHRTNNNINRVTATIDAIFPKIHELYLAERASL